MRFDYKTRLDLDNIAWLKEESARTGVPQTTIVNNAIQVARNQQEESTQGDGNEPSA